MPGENILIEEYAEDNQFILFFQSLMLVFLDLSFKCTIFVAYYAFLPIRVTYAIIVHIMNQIFLITNRVINDIVELSKIIPLTVQIWFWSSMIFLEYLFLLKRTAEIAVEVEKKIYKRIKLIITILNGFPLDSKHAVALYSALKKIPIFGGAIPFPHFLFEQTFKEVTFKEGQVDLIILNSDVEPNQTQEGSAQSSTAIATATATDDGPKGVLKKRKSVTIAPSIIEEEHPLSTDQSSVEEQPESSSQHHR